MNSTTQGVDIIASYRTDLYDGNFSATFAGNLNETQIDSVNAAPGIPKV